MTHASEAWPQQAGVARSGRAGTGGGGGAEGRLVSGQRACEACEMLQATRALPVTDRASERGARAKIGNFELSGAIWVFLSRAHHLAVFSSRG